VEAARSGLTLAGLSLLVVLMALWGWSAMTEPFPRQAEAPKCLDEIVQPGQRVFPGRVTVSVFNASGREGLAGRTLSEFEDAGFGPGDTGNAPPEARVTRAAIWSPTPTSPDVRLVATRLGPATRVVKREGLGVGVTVVVGDEFRALVKGPGSVRVTEEHQICSPPV
jgi:hypothetical protein